MMKIVKLMLLIASSACMVGVVTGFAVSKDQLPRYDKAAEKWIPTGPNQLPEAGYPPVKTFLLQGPKPFLTRVFQQDDYEQAVLKFMAGDNIVDRDVAQGNMDAYLRNPQDWMFNRMESQRRGIDIDYTSISTQGIVLVVAWSSIVFFVVGRAVYSVANGVGFYDFLS